MNEDYKTKDYSYLEGKTIKYIYDNEGFNEKFKAVVSGCDYDIGISIEVVTDKEKEHVRRFFKSFDPYLICLPGLSTKESQYNAICQSNNYDECFKRFVHKIECGVINSSIADDLCTDKIGFDMSECTFK